MTYTYTSNNESDITYSYQIVGNLEAVYKKDGEEQKVWKMSDVIVPMKEMEIHSDKVEINENFYNKTFVITGTLEKYTTAKGMKKAVIMQESEYDLFNFWYKIAEIFENSYDVFIALLENDIDKANDILKDALQKAVEDIAYLLNDTTVPTINIEDGAILNSDTKIEAEDENELILVLNGTEIENNHVVTDGEYELVTYTLKATLADGSKVSGFVETTLGLLIFNEVIPQDLGFVDRTKPENKYVDELLEKVAKNVDVDIPEEMVEEEINRLMGRFEEQMKMQGISLELYYQFTGSNEEALRSQMEKEAYKNVLYRLMLEEIMTLEKVEISEEEVDKEVEALANKYQMDKEDFLREFGGLEMVQYDLEVRKTVELLKELNK